MKNQHKHQTAIELYRQRMGFTATQVARLMGHRDSSTVSDYEHGKRLPSLENALRLGVILRVPVEFLFGTLYDQLRAEVRRKEERLTAVASLSSNTQGV